MEQEDCIQGTYNFPTDKRHPIDKLLTFRDFVLIKCEECGCYTEDFFDGASTRGVYILKPFAGGYSNKKKSKVLPSESMTSVQVAS